MIQAFGGLLAALLSIPPVRLFLEDVVIRVFSEVLLRSDQDPAFRTKFLDLSSQLAAAQTEGEKREILIKIRDLRKPAA